MLRIATLGFVLLAASLILLPPVGHTTPVFYYVHLLNDGGTPDYTGLLEIDDSRLTPNTFTPWSDPGLIAFEISIGPWTWTKDTESDLGVITDAQGDVVSFHNSTIGTQINNTTAGTLLRIAENNGFWLTNLGANGPAHSIEPIPEPASLLLVGVGLAGATVIRRVRKVR